MEERPDPAAVALDDGDRGARHMLEVERPPLRVDPPPLALEPEREPERRVAERLGDRRRAAAARARGRPSSRRPSRARAGSGGSRAGTPTGRAGTATRKSAPKTSSTLGAIASSTLPSRSTTSVARPGRVDGQEDAPRRRRRGAPAADEHDHDADPMSAAVNDGRDDLDDRARASASRDDDRAVRAVGGAPGVRRLAEQEDDRRPEDDEPRPSPRRSACPSGRAGRSGTRASAPRTG